MSEGCETCEVCARKRMIKESGEDTVTVMVLGNSKGNVYDFDVRVDSFLEDVKGLVGARHVISLVGPEKRNGYDVVIFYDKSGRRKRKTVNKNMPYFVGTGVMCMVDPTTGDYVNFF